MLENLIYDANATQDSALQPHSYGWFVYVALSRLAGIHFTQTKKAEQQLRLHKRGQRPAPPPSKADTPPASNSGDSRTRTCRNSAKP
jgi:hypothetical protein